MTASISELNPAAAVSAGVAVDAKPRWHVAVSLSCRREGGTASFDCQMGGVGVGNCSAGLDR